MKLIAKKQSWQFNGQKHYIIFRNENYLGRNKHGLTLGDIKNGFPFYFLTEDFRMLKF
jgi:hypothetical protein